jgi:hypothetical protein
MSKNLFILFKLNASLCTRKIVGVLLFEKFRGPLKRSAGNRSAWHLSTGN